MEYLSLYDYLKKPAGEKLGLEVAAEARKLGIPTQTRNVSNPRFTGTVFLYPKEFLEFYFREPDSTQMEWDVYVKNTIGNLGDDDLPKGHDWMGNLGDDDLPF